MLSLSLSFFLFYSLSVEEEEEDEEMMEAKPGPESEQQDDDENRETKEGTKGGWMDGWWKNKHHCSDPDHIFYYDKIFTQFSSEAFHRYNTISSILTESVTEEAAAPFSSLFGHKRKKTRS